MAKISSPPRGPEAGPNWSLFYPFTPALFTCCGRDGRANVFAALGQSVMGRSPLTMGVSVCRRQYNEKYWERFSYHLILESMAFVYNVATADLVERLTACGSASGWDVADKFTEVGLTPVTAQIVSAPLIAECPINLECVVRQIVNVGSHDMFVGEVVMIHMDEDVAQGEVTLAWRDLPRVTAPGEQS